MIPRKIHYCWFGRGEMPQVAKDCIASWHKYMPDWEYQLWNEDNFDVDSVSYTKEAYEARKYAFVSDYVRLWALDREGGLYLDTDVKVFKPMDTLLHNRAFAGFEGSKYKPVGTCVMASEAHGQWVTEMKDAYSGRHFINPEGILDMRTNVQFITAIMSEKGFKQDGKEQEYRDLHIFPVDYFSPRQTTGEYFRTDNTYCDHLGIGSWTECRGWGGLLKKILGQKLLTRLIKLKRKIIG